MSKVQHPLTYLVNQPGNLMWDYCGCVECLPPHRSHYLRNAVEMWTMRMKTKTWDVAAVVTRVLMWLWYQNYWLLIGWWHSEMILFHSANHSDDVFLAPDEILLSLNPSNQLISLKTVLLEKLIAAQPVQKFYALYKIKRSIISCSQGHSTGPCTESDESQLIPPYSMF